MSYDMIKFRHVVLILLAVLILASTSICVKAATGNITLKWNTSVYNNNTEIMPLMGDVDNDGTQEIIFSSGGNIYSLNGKTGGIEWSIDGSAGSAPELADLNNDGIPEILYGMNGPKVRALNGDGSILWTTVKLKGDGQSQFPLIAYDVDGDGYPNIYFASEDTAPATYSGNISDYNGAFTMLDHNGNVLADTWLFHPCWGGPSLGDYNFDGKFEVYVSDRRSAGYLDGKTAKGLQAFDAHTLEPLWQRPDIQHSSPMPILADVNGDGTLEVVAQKITIKGPMILNASNGKTIADYSNNNLPTHGTGTVYDIDHDGNLEIIMASGYPDSNSTPMDFAVFDLVSGVTEFRPNFTYHASWPPKVGDVTGDGDMEILAGMGNQGSKTASYPVLIYDRNFNLVANISISGSGQLMPVRIYDTDSDGYNEMVVAGLSGKISVFDTLSPTPNPAPRTWVQMYSEYRLGAAEYVDPPGPKAPMIRNESIKDGAEDVSLAPKLSFITNDFQNDLINITFEINDGSGWKVIKTYENVGRGTYAAETEEYVTEFNKQYQWRATTDDGNGHTNQKMFTFFTITPSTSWLLPGWVFRRPITINHTLVAGELNDFPVLINVTLNPDYPKTDGSDILFTSDDGTTKLSHEIEHYDLSSGHLVAWVKVPILSASEDTVLYMYYDNKNAEDQQDPEAVWDENYLAVHHLEETSGLVIDSTAHNNNGVPNGTILDAKGIIDGADQFDGVDDSTVLPAVFTNQSQFTIEGWYSTESKQGYIMAQRDTAFHGAFIQYSSDGNLEFYIDNLIVRRATTTGGSWHYFSATFDGTTARLYTDNNTAITNTVLTPSATWPAQSLYLGNRKAGDRAFQGNLDEIRVSDIARSDEYMRTSYNNQYNPAVFAVPGAEQIGLLKPIIFNVSPSYDEIDLPIDVELSFNLLDNQNNPMDVFVNSSQGTIYTLLNVSNGRHSVHPTDLKYGTAYEWSINVTDGTNWNYQVYKFTTIPAYNLSVTLARGNGSVEKNPTSQQYIRGTEVGLTANPQPGWEFIGWCGDINGNVNPTSIIMNSDKKVSAFFKDPTSLLVDSSFDDSIDSDDLRRDCGLQKWYESRVDKQDMLVLDENDVAGNSGKKARLDESLIGNAYLTQSFAPQSGNLSLQWDIYVDTILDYANADNAARQFVGTDLDGSNPNGKGSERFVVMAFYHENGSTTPGDTMSLLAQRPGNADYNSSQWAIVASDLRMDRWYTIKVELDLTARTYDVYIDGILRASDIPAYANLTSISHISFATWNDGIGTFYVDNVSGQVLSNASVSCIDNDGDGYGDNCDLGADCDDSDSTVHPGAADAICNGVDNDCDLSIDENYVINATSCGIGACAAAGQKTCDAGDEFDNCVAGMPTGDDSNCNGLDENCDGTPDNAYVPTSTTCGVGACAASGQLTCVAGFELDSCAQGLPSTESCDSIDNNCDGAVDEGCSCTDGETRSCGSSNVSVCVYGNQSCVSGQWDVCIGNIEPSPELCDNQDNNCNGQVDEGLFKPASVLDGLCANNTEVCSAGNWSNSVNSYAPVAESCDGLDNNCDGTIDEGCVQNCTESWSCADWTACSGGSQSRICVDSNACNTTINRPIEIQSCVVARGGGGGGGSSFSNEQNWNCGEWSACVNSKQSQVCKHKTQNAEKTNTRSCTETPKPTQPVIVEQEAANVGSGSGAPSLVVESSVSTPSGSNAAGSTIETENAKSDQEDAQAAVPEMTGAVAGATAKGSSIWWLVAIVAVLAVLLSLYFVVKKMARKGQY